MSFQQKIVRINKLMKAYNRYKPSSNNSWTDKTFLLRNTLWQLDSLTLNLNERNYLDTRWTMIETYLVSNSAAELAMKMEIAKCSTTFHPLDYIAIIIGFSQKYINDYLFEKNVIIEMIDKYNWFDNAIKNTKCLKILLKILSLDEKNKIHGDPKDMRQVIAHILTKFPDMKKHNFMYRKYKGKQVLRFDDDQIKNNF